MKDDFSIDSILGSLDSKENNSSKEVKSYSEPAKKDVNREDYRKTTQNGKPSGSKKKKKKKKKNGAAGVIWGIIIVLVSLALAAGILICSCEILGIGKELLTGSKTVQVYVEEGTSIKDIAQMLKDNNIIISKEVFLAYLKIKKVDTVFSYGYHDFKQDMGYSQIIETLGETAKKEDVSVTIRAGLTVTNIAAILEKNNICSAEDFLAAVDLDVYESPLLDAVPKDDSRIKHRIEGYLYPDTYCFFRNDDPKRVIQKMLDNTESHFSEELRTKAKEMGYTTHEIMSLASVVELEASGYSKEMPNVAAVFWNRITKWPEGQRLLQSDPTVTFTKEYGLDSSYDTYNHEGISPSPYCNVTEDAIKGTINYNTESDNYFFVTDSLHRFYYNKTTAAHNSTISSLISKGIWKE